MSELTDAEILTVMSDGNGCRENDWQNHIDFARAIIATPPAAPVPESIVLVPVEPTAEMVQAGIVG